MMSQKGHISRDFNRVEEQNLSGKTKNILEVLQESGAVIRQLWGDFLSDGLTGEAQTGSTAVILSDLLLELQKIGVSSDDLKIVSPYHVRGEVKEKSYILLSIPKLKRQILLCPDQYRPILISADIKPVHFWVNTSLEEMRKKSQVKWIIPESSNKEWKHRALKCVIAGIEDPLAVKKVSMSKNQKAIFLTEDTLIRWIQATHKKKGRWPRQIDKEVWDVDSQGNLFLVIGEKWGSLECYCRQNGRGLYGLKSLRQLREKHKLTKYPILYELNENRIVQLIHDYHEKTGSFPSVRTKDVWQKTETGWKLLEADSWHAIDRFCYLNNLGSLAQLKRKHRFFLSKEDREDQELLQLILDTQEKTNSLPTPKTKDVWKRTHQGWIVDKRKSWRSIFSELCQRGFLNSSEERLAARSNYALKLRSIFKECVEHAHRQQLKDQIADVLQGVVGFEQAQFLIGIKTLAMQFVEKEQKKIIKQKKKEFMRQQKKKELKEIKNNQRERKAELNGWLKSLQKEKGKNFLTRSSENRYKPR